MTSTMQTLRKEFEIVGVHQRIFSTFVTDNNKKLDLLSRKLAWNRHLKRGQFYEVFDVAEIFT